MSKQPEEFQDLTEENTTDVAQTEQLYQPLPRERPTKKPLLIVAVIAGLIALAVIGFLVNQRKNISPSKQIPQPITTPTLSPNPTPEPTFNRAEWSLEVLNGSGLTGAAKKLADKLVQLGYKIVKTGNADRSDYIKNQLFVSTEMRDKQDLLLEDLKKEISIASVSGELKDSTASARIIIGSNI